MSWEYVSPKLANAMFLGRLPELPIVLCLLLHTYQRDNSGASSVSSLTLFGYKQNLAKNVICEESYLKNKKSGFVVVK